MLIYFVLFFQRCNQVNGFFPEYFCMSDIVQVNSPYVLVIAKKYIQVLHGKFQQRQVACYPVDVIIFIRKAIADDSQLVLLYFQNQAYLLVVDH